MDYSVKMKFKNNITISIIGLGYVGLPLAVEFSKKYKVIGFDKNISRIEELNRCIDRTGEIKNKKDLNSKNLIFTKKKSDIKKANIYIITVPTPVNQKKLPDLRLIKEASNLVGKYLKKNDVVIYESTVYPGTTEEICVPILKKNSGLVFNKDFYCGYSPERMNPGDKAHNVTNIKKVVSGSTEIIAKKIANLYLAIVRAGVHQAESIKIAEAAKVIENSQRDLNIAFVNELSIIFNLMKIDTNKVLDAAATKWNFIDFRPGLVGGHCIGVDPYYLTYKAKSLGYNPKVILSGRQTNDKMGSYAADQLLNKLKQSLNKKKYKVLIMGYTFKENCNDIRNTRVIDIVKKLKHKKCTVDIYDPFVDMKSQKFNFIKYPNNNMYDAILIAVGHKIFREMGINKIRGFGKKKNLFYDIKNIFPSDEVDLIF